MDEQQAEPIRWVWQGFFGPTEAAVAAYATVQKGLDQGGTGFDVGMKVPEENGPMLVDKGGVMAMFAVQTRPWSPMPVPEGMFEADPAMVGRLVGA